MTSSPMSARRRGKSRLFMNSRTASRTLFRSKWKTASTSFPRSSIRDISRLARRRCTSRARPPPGNGTAMAPVSSIEDKTPRPPGLLPKNVQSWLLAGLAVLMVLIMWLTGGKKAPSPSKALPPAPAVLPPPQVNEAKIVELQKRIEELQREQAVAESALANENRALARSADARVEQPGAAGNSARPEQPEDAIQAEHRKREYLSLFSSNVALSYRKTPPTAREEGQTALPAVSDG